MKNILSIASILAVTAVASFGCSSSDDTSNPADTGTPTTDTGTGDTAKDTTPSDTPAETKDSTPTDTPTDTPGFPAPPTLGAQIDRMGRPGVNTALNHAFDIDAAAKGSAKDAYNQDKDPTNWVKPTVYVPQFMANLGVLDSLDGTCGNQLAYKTPTAATSYATLAGLLASDMLWLKTDGTTCSLDKSPNLTDTPPGGYLAVEANAAVGLTNTDCGGRTLSYDVMNLTYGLVAAGAAGIGTHLDGILTVPARSTGTTFPYLAAPHP